MTDSPCCPSSNKKNIDWLLWGSIAIVMTGYICHLAGLYQSAPWFAQLTMSFYALMNKMWLGLGLGIFFVGLLNKVPRAFVLSIIGKPGSITGIFRATLAGLLLDLCSHGVLLIGMKLYERGASLGQTFAFLIASPWNSFSLTIILVALIGWKATLVFVIISAIIAILSGLLFDFLEKTGVLPKNPNSAQHDPDFAFWPNTKKGLQATSFDIRFFSSLVIDGLKDSRMILRWIFFGVILASLIRTFVNIEIFQTWFGPNIKGLSMTLLFATVMEICSEGSTPIAADLVTRAKALGNGFTFLMAGVSTDYTEIMSIKETTSSWKVAFFLPLVTLPQVLLLGYILNFF